MVSCGFKFLKMPVLDSNQRKQRHPIFSGNYSLCFQKLAVCPALFTAYLLYRYVELHTVA